MIKDENYKLLSEICKGSGASLFGVGYIADLEDNFEFLSRDTIKGLSYGISFGIRLSMRIIDDIEDHPTRLYLHHYRSINIMLDQIGIKAANHIQENGYDALPIPASQIMDWKKQTAHISHKMIGVRAGLGWIGRNNLLVNPHYGSCVRYGTILTDMPLKTDKALKFGCNNCMECVRVCPVNAIKKNVDEFERIVCLDRLKYYAKTYNIGHYICGICVEVCRGKKRF
ncbi:MAG: 4Fe-4S binding protein [Nitrospirota bacterium]